MITLVVISPEKSLADEETLPFIEQITKEYGASGRTYKSALVFAIADSPTFLNEETRKLLAWQDIEANEYDRLDDVQKKHLSENISKAKRDLREAVWRTYKNVAILNRDNSIRIVDLGLVHSSAADSMAAIIMTRLNEEDESAPNVSSSFLIRNWPPAHTEWSTRSVRNVFFASPLFPRLTNPESLRDTIVRGVGMGQIAYVGKSESGRYEPFCFEIDLSVDDIEFSEEMYIIKEDEARKHIEPPSLSSLEITPQYGALQVGRSLAFFVKGLDQHGQEFPVNDVEWSATGGKIDNQGVFLAGEGEGEFGIIAYSAGKSATARVVITSEQKTTPSSGKLDIAEAKFSWSGEIPSQKWMHFYTKVLAKFVNLTGLKIHVRIDVAPSEDLSEQKIEEARYAIREMQLGEDSD